MYGRSPERTKRIAEDFGAQPAPWEQRSNRSGETLVNCTNVGMWPDVDETPMPVSGLADCRYVFDVIYNPLETQLLRDARATGIVTVNGLDMFVRQAAGAVSSVDG